MQNFTRNSRFDVLNEENTSPIIKNKKNVKKESNELKKDSMHDASLTSSPKSKMNTFKNEQHFTYEKSNYENTNFKDRRDKNRKMFEERNKEMEKNKKEKEREESLKESNFPDLILNKKKETQSEKTDNCLELKPNIVIQYAAKLKNIQPMNETKNQEEIIDPGWVCLRVDPTNKRKIVWEYGPKIYTDTDRNKQELETHVKVDVLHKILDSREKQKQQYIELWGEEEYEKKYGYNNDVAEYFEKLDEEYEEEMEKIQEENNILDEYENY
jgi:hypothetical protein